jgi:hypothetical protein
MPWPWPICRLAIAHLGALDQEEQRQVKDLDDGCTWAEIGISVMEIRGI